MKLIFFLSFFLTLACSKSSSLIEEKDKILGIDHIDTYIDNIKPVDWKVGDFRAHVLHKGFLLMVKLPHLEKSQVEKLLAKTPVNAWVVRIFKTNDSGMKQLGSIYVPFSNLGPGGAIRINTQEAIYVNVFYAAAALSGRLENLKCPAMNHRKMLDAWEVKKEEGQHKVIISFSNTLPDTPSKSEILPEVLNGDMSLIGDYTVDIALYNSESKILHSEFIPVAGKVKITAEKEVEVKACDNFEVPTPDYDQKEKLKQFRFK